MNPHPRAGQPADPSELIDVDQLVTAYHEVRPDPAEASQRVAFGTSGHRGSALSASFNEAHVVAMAAATCRYRREQGIDGPLYLGRDTHALSKPALATTVEVLAAAGVEVVVDAADGYTPTPVISHAILAHNRNPLSRRADGIVITPSHNPPEDGGFKYNPPHGGPADVDATSWIQDEANRLLADGLRGVERWPHDRAVDEARRHDYVSAYVDDLPAVVDMDAIRASGVRLGADPLGGAAVDYWAAIAERHRIDLTVVNDTVDPTFGFMRRDHDGKLRMDCSSPHAMGGLIAMGDRFDVAFGNDPDADRHGIVTAGAGLLNPNEYLAAAVAYLFGGVRDWPAGAAIGKTVVTSGMLDRIAADLGRPLEEVPVGFKWFVPGLLDGSLGFGGEESAGGSFLRRDGSAWATDKDGLILALLAAEMTAHDGRDPGQRYAALTERFGAPASTRIDVPATREEKAVLAALAPEQVEASDLAGEPITAVLTAAPGNGAPIGGLKVVADSGWFAARPSGTEDIYKVYAESFRGDDHLQLIVDAARSLVDSALSAPS